MRGQTGIKAKVTGWRVVRRHSLKMYCIALGWSVDREKAKLRMTHKFVPWGTFWVMN